MNTELLRRRVKNMSNGFKSHMRKQRRTLRNGLNVSHSISLGLNIVLCQFLILGYNDFSFCRAFSMVNCQSTPLCLSLLDIAQASVSSRSISMFGMRRPERHWRVMELNSFSAIFSQLPCFGVKRNSRRFTIARA